MASFTDLPAGLSEWKCVALCRRLFCLAGEARKSLPKNTHCLESTNN